MSHLDSSDEECNIIPNNSYNLYQKTRISNFNNNCDCNSSSDDEIHHHNVINDYDNDGQSSCCDSLYQIECPADNNKLNLGQVLYYDGKDIAGSNNFKYDASANDVIIDGKLTVTGIQLIPQCSNPFSNVSGILWYNKNNNLFYTDNTPINNT